MACEIELGPWLRQLNSISLEINWRSLCSAASERQPATSRSLLLLLEMWSRRLSTHLILSLTQISSFFAALGGARPLFLLFCCGHTLDLTGSVFLRSIADNDKVVAHITEREREREKKREERSQTHTSNTSLQNKSNLLYMYWAARDAAAVPLELFC